MYQKILLILLGPKIKKRKQKKTFFSMSKSESVPPLTISMSRVFFFDVFGVAIIFTYLTRKIRSCRTKIGFLTSKIRGSGKSQTTQFVARSKDLIKLLQKVYQGAVFISSNPYLLALITFYPKQSTKFIASPLSSWSQTVLVDRMAAGIMDDESILSICLPDVTDVPELTWLFPEGE